MVSVSSIIPVILFLGVSILAASFYIQSSTPLTNLTVGLECSELGLTYNIDPGRVMMKYSARASFTGNGESRSIDVDYTVVVLNNICEGQAIIYGQIDKAEGDNTLLGLLARFTLTNFQLPQAVPATSYYYILPVEAIESTRFNESITSTGSIIRPSYGLLNTITQNVEGGFKQYTTVKWNFDKETGILLELSFTGSLVDTSGVERQRIDVDIKHESLYLLDNETQLYINPRPLAWSSSLSLTIFGVSIVLAAITLVNRIFV